VRGVDLHLYKASFSRFYNLILIRSDSPCYLAAICGKDQNTLNQLMIVSIEELSS
jgi:hypothetical protein